jgi:putative transposase
MFDPEIHRRRWRRLPNRDYSAPGAYFVTLCTRLQSEAFGELNGGAVVLSIAGKIVVDSWLNLATRYSHVAIDEWRIMPGHFHGVLIFSGRAGPGPSSPAKPLGGVIGAFKTESTNRINRARGTQGGSVWQRDFWDHVVRDDADLIRIREYIRHHPPHVVGGAAPNAIRGTDADTDTDMCRGGS